MRDMTPEEIERYAPYHTFEAFWTGFNSYPAACPAGLENSVDGQAFDRGAEMAMTRQIAAFRKRTGR